MTCFYLLLDTFGGSHLAFFSLACHLFLSYSLLHLVFFLSLHLTLTCSSFTLLLLFLCLPLCYNPSLPASIPISPGSTVAAPSTGHLAALWAGSAVAKGDCILEVLGCLAEVDGCRLARMNIEALHFSPSNEMHGEEGKSSETGRKINREQNKI